MSGMPAVRVVGDGSSVADAHPADEIDCSEPAQRWRYVCPNGHTDWDCTNNHIWGRGCRRQVEAGDDDVTPEHWQIYDKQRDRSIPWSAVQLGHHKQTTRRGVASCQEQSRKPSQPMQVTHASRQKDRGIATQLSPSPRGADARPVTMSTGASGRRVPVPEALPAERSRCLEAPRQASGRHVPNAPVASSRPARSGRSRGVHEQHVSHVGGSQPRSGLTCSFPHFGDRRFGALGDLAEDRPVGEIEVLDDNIRNDGAGRLSSIMYNRPDIFTSQRCRLTHGSFWNRSA